MKVKAFRELLSRLNGLTSQQRQVVESTLNRLANENAVCKELNQTSMKECPHCSSEHLQKWGWKDHLQRYRCKACRSTFNCLTGTKLLRLRKKEQWLEVIESLNQKETLDQMQDRLGISRMTAVRWRKRFLSALKDPKQKTLTGIVEADETFVRQSIKGSRAKERKPRKRGEPAQYGGTHPDDYVCVWTARDRSKETAHQITTDQKTPVFKAFLKPLVARESILCSDGKTGYIQFAGDEGIHHVVLSARNREFVKEGVYHIQNVNAYHSRLKRFLSGLRGVATCYLDYYLTWLDHLDTLASQQELLTPLKIFRSKILHT
jgi:transposase-like protein